MAVLFIVVKNVSGNENLQLQKGGEGNCFERIGLDSENGPLGNEGGRFSAVYLMVAAIQISGRV